MSTLSHERLVSIITCGQSRTWVDWPVRYGSKSVSWTVSFWCNEPFCTETTTQELGLLAKSNQQSFLSTITGEWQCTVSSVQFSEGHLEVCLVGKAALTLTPSMRMWCHPPQITCAHHRDMTDSHLALARRPVVSWKWIRQWPTPLQQCQYEACAVCHCLPASMSNTQLKASHNTNQRHSLPAVNNQRVTKVCV